MGKAIVDTIPHSANIKIDVPGGFYHRLQQLLFSYSAQRPEAELLDAMNRFKDPKEEPKTEWEYHLYTLVVLVNEIEKAAKDQDQLKKEEVELPNAPST